MEGTEKLREAAIPEARRDAGSLLAHVLGRERSFLIAHADEAVADEEIESFRFLIKRRAGGEPMQYITGHQEFFKLDFEVTPAILIPRPETELIVEAGVETLLNHSQTKFPYIRTGACFLATFRLH